MVNNDIEMLTLDTHILLWYLEGIELNERQVASIESARKKNKLYISAISIWEISLLANRGRIAFAIDMKEWVSQVMNIPGLNMIELSPDVLIESTILPTYMHKDPADRMIIASARSMNSYLMTKDEKIIEYGNNGYVKIAC